MGREIGGVAPAASALPFFAWSLALAATFQVEDEHALKANAAAKNAQRRLDLTKKV